MDNLKVSSSISYLLTFRENKGFTVISEDESKLSEVNSLQ